MTSTAARSAPGRATAWPRIGTVPDLLGGGAVVVAAAGATWWLLDPPASYPWVTAGMYLALAMVLLSTVPERRPGAGLGAASRVTLGRGGLAVAVAALCLPPTPLAEVGRWWVIGLSTVVLVLDGVDGRVARATGTESDFGARFDMELDAAFLLALAVLVWSEGRAGVWCLLIGLMRYLFVAAGWLIPSLRAELPPSLRRKVVCVVQGVVLLVALGPIIPPALARLVVAGGLLSLTYSFAVDARWAIASADRTDAPGVGP